MATEVLRPQDCLIQRIRVNPTACTRRRYENGSFNASYSYNYSNNNSGGNVRFNRKPAQRKRVGSEQHISRRSSSAEDLKMMRNSITMEKVTTLRRGESWDSKIKSTSCGRETGLVVMGTDRLGPDPEMVSEQIKIVDIRSPVAIKLDMYVGSGFAVSPSSSSLPLPSFSKKKQISIDDSATRDLRRLLRLDL